MKEIRARLLVTTTNPRFFADQYSFREFSNFRTATQTQPYEFVRRDYFSRAYRANLPRLTAEITDNDLTGIRGNPRKNTL
ncbi:hypothetical protein B0G69_5664 [Paraburkholderia sp. RAU2J]|nr:hypothetical protein B0G69_5664 [Paraburkholderia sp. RAU2J]